MCFDWLIARLVPNSTTRTPATDMLCNTTKGHHQWTSSRQVVDFVQHVRSRLNLLYSILLATPTDELTTVLQLVVQQIHHQRTKICHIPISWHVDMLGSGIVMWQIYCTTSCRIVVSLSVGVLYNMSVADVRVVEFGTYGAMSSVFSWEARFQ